MEKEEPTSNLDLTVRSIEPDIEYLYQKLLLLCDTKYKFFIERFIDNYQDFTDNISKLLESLLNKETLTDNSKLALLLKEYYHLLLEFNEYFSPEDKQLENSLNNVLTFLIQSNKSGSESIEKAA